MYPLQAVYLIWGMWTVTWLAASFWSGRTVGRSGDLVYYIPVVAGVAMLFSFSRLRGSPVLWPSDNDFGWTMVAIAACGFLFAWWARIHLGSLWSGPVTIKEGHHVVDTGPYRFVRHPIYTGIIFAAFATAFIKATSLALAGAAIMSAGWYMKARIEERLLEQTLGQDAYRSYAARVPMLLPYAPRT
jgi:protein-S-isoprenylcysteine O-methyltransferase Ste14